MQTYGMQNNKVMKAKGGLKVKRRGNKKSRLELQKMRENKTISYAKSLTRNHYANQ